MNGTQEKKDIAQKDFMAFPDIMADTINALLYQGKVLVNAENLWAGPTETVYEGREKLRDQYEDLCKYELSDGRIRLMYLIANQTAVDGKMLLRKAGYTGGAYREQYEGKTQDLFPVIEFVLYWGEPRWRSSRDIRRLFAKRRLPEETWKYIDDLKLYVYEMRHLPQETRELFQSDMRIVVDFLAEGNSYRSDRKIRHKATLIRMIKALSGENDTENIEDWLEQKGIREEDEITVCELFDQYVRQGRAEGLIEGKAEGLIEGKAKGLIEGKAEGLIEGKAKGLIEGKAEGLIEGKAEGRLEGKAEGRLEGKAEGKLEGKARQLVEDIERTMAFFQVTLEKACECLGITVSGYEEAKNFCK